MDGCIIQEIWMEKRNAMLLQVIENTIIINGSPYAENLQVNFQPENRRARIKLTYIHPEPQLVDLVLAYKMPVVSLPLVHMGIEGQERERDIYFKFNIEFSLLDKSLILKGRFGNTKLTTSISSPIELLDFIKSIIQTKGGIENVVCI